MPIREISAAQVTQTVRDLCLEATTVLGDDVLAALEAGRRQEESPTGQEILDQILDNARIAKEESISLCQDAGLAVVFVEIGQEVHVNGGGLEEAINEGVRQGYAEGYLRPSTLDPVSRKNTGDNTPAIIHYQIVPGRQLKLTALPKGFGGENVSLVRLFPPSLGIKGAKSFIVQQAIEGAAKACAPMIVGVGLGGNLEKAALIAKQSLLRPLGQRHPRAEIATLEEELLEEINRSGVGPLGLGGRMTALEVHIKTYPTHIGSLPVAINLQCHSHRLQAAVL
jgi:fumarate hydratase subunit alpha